MYNSIVVTNSITCKNKTIKYKFTLVFDKINWKTNASLKLYDMEYISIMDGDLFGKVIGGIKPIFEIPFDPNGVVYSGPELKIRLTDTNSSTYWANMTNLKCEYDNAFRIPDLYVDQENQNIYTNVIKMLIKLSDDIFREQINE